MLSILVKRYLGQLAQMGTFTDSILVEIEARLADVENIIYADENGEIASSFLDLLKKKLARCSKLLIINVIVVIVTHHSYGARIGYPARIDPWCISWAVSTKL